MREGSLEAPTRHPLPWRDEAFYDTEKLDAELRRVFDICHGCRRCFNLCDSFPRLFDLIDESPTGELNSVDSADFAPVVDACTLCDMCFLTKCPYVPPHDFDLDFPHLMLRYRAAEHRAGKVGFIERQMTETDRNGRLGRIFPGIANWGMDTSVLRGLAGIAKDAALPKFNARTLEDRAKAEAPQVNAQAPAHGRKAVIYATCFANFNIPAIGMAALNVLAINGVETVVVHPECCGMAQLEHGDIGRVAKSAARVSAEMKGWIEKGYDVVSLISSCSLMLKFEWPLILPENENVKRLGAATFDIAEYVVDIASKEGLADGLVPLAGDVTLHIACHARAQNMGRKGAELLSKIPDTKIDVIERCSGHGGSWGVMKDNFEVALKVGKPVARQAVKNKPGYVVSECPLARDHILQGMERLDGEMNALGVSHHPIQLLAEAYGYKAGE